MNFPLPEAPTPLSVISTIITTVIAPVVAWLVGSASRLVKRVNILDARFRERMKDLDRIIETHETHTVRLTKVEEAIVAIQQQQVRNDAQYDAINQKLEQLPRVVALLESYAERLRAIESKAWEGRR